MIRDEAHWLALTDRFHAASIDSTGWYPALEGLAEATGSSSGQLISIGTDAAVTLNLMTNVSPELNPAFLECNGGHPDVNPRVKAGMEAPVLKILAESDFITPEEHKRHPHYQEFARRFDIPYICLTTLDRKRDGLIGLAVNRTALQGHITQEQRRTFASIAPHVRAAVRTHIALEGSGDALLAGAMEAMAIPAFICDETGRVRRLTPAAEAIVASGRGLQLRLGRLNASMPADAQALNDAIGMSAAARGKVDLPCNRTVVVRKCEQDAAPLVLDVITLANHQFGFTFAPRVLLIVRGAGAKAADQRRTAILQTVYGMTATETQIALQIFAGKSIAAIATARGVSIETERTQVKAVMTKAGVRRQVEFVARLGQM
jgi:DNA-binding CsgD family transcriptional regulator/PAS domain-containing protein